MERAFGADFADVRNCSAGLDLLGHDLTRVLQQWAGRVEGAQSKATC